MATIKHKKCNGKKSRKNCKSRKNRKSCKSLKNKMRGGSRRSRLGYIPGTVTVSGPDRDLANEAALAHNPSKKNLQSTPTPQPIEQTTTVMVDGKPVLVSAV